MTNALTKLLLKVIVQVHFVLDLKPIICVARQNHQLSMVLNRTSYHPLPVVRVAQGRITCLAWWTSQEEAPHGFSPDLIPPFIFDAKDQVVFAAKDSLASLVNLVIGNEAVSAPYQEPHSWGGCFRSRGTRRCFRPFA
jgi:hypothetical protein